jgi:hypothetical protein
MAGMMSDQIHCQKCLSDTAYINLTTRYLLCYCRYQLGMPYQNLNPKDNINQHHKSDRLILVKLV